jgi:hypothetical protein
MTYERYVLLKNLFFSEIKTDHFSDESTLRGIKEYYRWLIIEVMKTWGIETMAL